MSGLTPIPQGAPCECACQGCRRGIHCDKASCASSYDAPGMYLQAVVAFHEPNTPPSTCMWCGLPSPCPPYLQAQSALRQESSNE